MIKNPFSKETPKKKPNFKSAYDEGAITEGPINTPPSIILDGERYVIDIKNATTAKEAGERLLAFFHDLEGLEKQRVSAYGVTPLSTYPQEPEAGHILLRYGNKTISIYVGDDKSPEAAYRRIGYTIQGLGPHLLLKKHGITVTERA
jgi:hypothetical protein